MTKPRKPIGDLSQPFSNLLAYSRMQGFEDDAPKRLWRILVTQAMGFPGGTDLTKVEIPVSVLRVAASQPLDTYRAYGPEKQRLLQGWVKTF